MARLLVIEDDTDVREWISHCAERDSHEPRGVPDRARLLALRDAEPDYRPSLVLMDYALPDTDGVELLAELREWWPGVPAVFVTVQWTGEIIERIQRTGAERVAKPFDPVALRSAIRRALDGEPPA